MHLGGGICASEYVCSGEQKHTPWAAESAVGRWRRARPPFVLQPQRGWAPSWAGARAPPCALAARSCLRWWLHSLPPLIRKPLNLISTVRVRTYGIMESDLKMAPFSSLNFVHFYLVSTFLFSTFTGGLKRPRLFR